MMEEKLSTIDLFFDDSGYTGEDFDNDEQRNYFLAALAIPQNIQNDLCKELKIVWENAALITKKNINSLELKGEQLYGGKGIFKSVILEDRLSILDMIFEVIIKYKIQIFWEGLPKHEWVLKTNSENKNIPFLPSVIFSFCKDLYTLFTKTSGYKKFRIIGDENNWIGPNSILKLNALDNWANLIDNGVLFLSSKEVVGLQLADIVVNTLYRANKRSCPNPTKIQYEFSKTDKIAIDFHKRLSDSFYNLGDTLKR
jgi:hypothetical protein